MALLDLLSPETLPDLDSKREVAVQILFGLGKFPIRKTGEQFSEGRRLIV